MAINRETLIEEEVPLTDVNADADAIALDSGLDLIDETEQPPVEVAMGRVPQKIGENTAQKVGDAINRPVRRQGENPLATSTKKVPLADPLVKTDGGKVYIRPISEEERMSIDTFSKVDPDFKLVIPNLKMIAEAAAKDPDNAVEASTAELQSLIGAIFETYKATPFRDGTWLRQNRTLKDVIKEAENIDAVDIFLQLLQREPGARTFTPAENFAASKVVVSIAAQVLDAKKSYRLSGKANDKAKYAQLIALQAASQMQLAGLKSDAGFAFVAQKIIVTPSKAYMDQMQAILERAGPDGPQINKRPPGATAEIDETNQGIYFEQWGGENKVNEFISMYESLPDERTKMMFARGVVSKFGAVMTEIYTSALLSNPLTHAYNAAGNGVMMELQVFDKLISSMLHKNPNEARQALAMLTAQAKYMPQALRSGWFALKHERSMSGGINSKFDNQMNVISAKGFNLRRRGDGGEGKEAAAALFLDGFGALMRLQGFRPMIAADEFFKTLGRGMEMERMGVEAQSAAYRAAMETGATKKQAQEASLEAYFKTLHSPEAYDSGQDFAKMITFQDDLPPLFDNLTGFFNNPIVKIFAPFYKTPTQIVRRIGERTPFVIPIDLLAKKNLKAKGPEGRAARTKLMTGSAVGATLIYAAKGGISDDVTFTGYGPTERNARKRWLENHKPYSIGVRQDDGSWTWISYERYDPIAGVMAMAADAADAVELSENPELNGTMLFNLGYATSRYVTSALPMTQFIGEFLHLAGSSFETSEKKAERMTQLLTRQIGNYGLTIGQHAITFGQGSNSLSGWLERTYFDPASSNTTPHDQYPDFMRNTNTHMQPVLRGFYEAYNLINSRIPGRSNSLPSKKNRWYEEQISTAYTMDDGSPRANKWQAYFPFKAINLPGKDLLNNELESLGIGLQMLSNTMGEPMVKLNAEQYDRYIELYNYPGRSKFPEVLTKKEKNLTAYGTYMDLLSPNTKLNKAYMMAERPGDKVKMLRSIDSDFKGIAKKLMILEYPELRALMTNRDEFKQYYGRNPISLGKPTDAELNRANREINEVLDQFR